MTRTIESTHNEGLIKTLQAGRHVGVGRWNPPYGVGSYGGRSLASQYDSPAIVQDSGPRSSEPLALAQIIHGA